ncbi:hypothetical protein CLV98_11349 [Dyadobacter jejuensis]|uniref:Uncharacterized protein n=1 Tax=Dyadobacter jejuensis TaxID=1082580 RepID=A0A316ACW0_9BACT|nr:hypothetical protein CLV98_11349 [Dyadobacter jejuensis]
MEYNKVVLYVLVCNANIYCDLCISFYGNNN